MLNNGSDVVRLHTNPMSESAWPRGCDVAYTSFPEHKDALAVWSGNRGGS